MKLIRDLITEPWQVEIMRQIYNVNLPHLATKPLDIVSETEQQMWWNNVRNHSVAHLYRPVDEPWKFVAFSLVQRRGAFSTPLFAIVETHWGKGYGKEIIQHYLEVAGGPLAGEALVSNRAIMELNQRAGWIEVSNDGRVARLYHPGLGNRQDEVYDEIVRYHGYS